MASHIRAEMSAQVLADYLRRIRLTHSIPALHALADEIDAAYPTDMATSTLVRFRGAKVERLVGTNQGARATHHGSVSFAGGADNAR